MSLDTTITLSPVAKTFYDKRLLTRLLATYQHGAFADEAQSVSIQQGGGISAEFRKWAALPAVTTPLTQGVTPTGSNASVTSITATPAEYGSYIEHSNVLEFVSIDPLISTYTDLCAEQAALTVDTLDRTTLAAGTNVQYAGGQISRGAITSSDKFNLLTELLNAVATLENANVPKIMDEFGGSYMCFVHPNIAKLIRKDTAFQRPDEYNEGTKVYGGELGRYGGVRFLPSTMAAVFTGAGAGGIDVYATTVFGAHWYGKINWGMKMSGVAKTLPGGRPSVSTTPAPLAEIIVKPKGSSGSADPLNQRGTVGWILNHVLLITNQACGVRIESAA